jgi:hypothetical protein
MTNVEIKMTKNPIRHFASFVILISTFGIRLFCTDPAFHLQVSSIAAA